jgi:ribose transport system ATP-binding protein
MWAGRVAIPSRPAHIPIEDKDVVRGGDLMVNALHSTRSLECIGLVKRFGGVAVVKSVDFSVPAGSVVGLIGENGAGKSTLSSIIAGIHQPDIGSMVLDGKPYAPHSPSDALGQGVALIHQEIRMVPQLSVAENIFLGRLPVKRGRLDKQLMNDEAAEILASLGVSLDPRRPVAGLSMAVQQSIEIAKSLLRQPRYVIFDEPSASLTATETDRVLHQITVLRDSGVGVVYISHRLDEVRTVSSEIVCMRDGSVVKRWTSGGVPTDDLVQAMVGRDFSFRHQAPPPSQETVVLSVSGLCRKGVFTDISFDLRKGEILGIAGLVGAGRTEMVRCIAGADKSDAGRITIDGSEVKIKNPNDAIRAGIVMVPEDRKTQGLDLAQNSPRNIAAPWERRMKRSSIVTKRWLSAMTEGSTRDFDIRGSLTDSSLRLSGGNQQKVLLAKWLVQDPKVLILDEPTRGVDVGAKMAIYEIIRKCAAAGVSVLVVSSELEEVLGLAHRVLVMSGGRQRAILDRDSATSESVMNFAVPVKTSDSNKEESTMYVGSSKEQL